MEEVAANSGSAYIFKTSDGGATWPQVAKLVAPDAEASDRFGYSVAVEGNLVVVGALQDDTYAGSAYAFLTSDGGATWDQGEKFVADDRAAEDRFGTDVEISGDVVVVGAHTAHTAWRQPTGAAYVFRATDGRAGWTQEAKLVASDVAANDLFGYAVSINEAGDVIAVGSFLDNDHGSWSGSAYVFRTTDGGATWTQAAKLAPGSENYRFGASLSISGNTLAVGAYGSDTFTGRAYLFSTTDNGASWTQDANLQGSGYAVNDRFGGRFGVVVRGALDRVADADPTTLVEACPGSAVQDENGIITLTLGVTIGVGHSDPFDALASPSTQVTYTIDAVDQVVMSSSTAGIDTQTVSESLDLGVAAHRVALASSSTAPCDIYSASASATMDANSRLPHAQHHGRGLESYVAFLKTATVRNLDSGLEYALSRTGNSPVRLATSTPEPGSTTPTLTSRS
ncbi:hypothetical protein JL722_9142 [Aureococcus anophagefferens]|nr:hypothetical protein JL722_9142 [Aureococcus anophagefferens]